MDLPVFRWSSRSLRSAVLPKDDVSELDSQLPNSRIRVPLELPVPVFVRGHESPSAPVEISLLDEDSSSFICQRTSPSRLHALPLPPWASTSEVESEPQYPPRPSAPRAFMNSGEPEIPYPSGHSMSPSSSRRQPILIKLLESTKVSQPLTFLRSKNPSSEQPSTPDGHSLSRERITRSRTPTERFYRKACTSETEGPRLRPQPTITSNTRPGQTDASAFGDCIGPRSRARESLESNSHREASQPLRPCGSRKSQRLHGGMKRSSTPCLATREEDPAVVPLPMPKSSIPPNSTHQAQNSALSPAPCSSERPRAPRLTRSFDMGTTTRCSTARFARRHSHMEPHSPRESRHSLGAHSSEPERRAKNGRGGGLTFESGPAHSTKITYTMAPSTNPTSHRQAITQQAQLLSGSNFTPPYSPCAQFSPRLSLELLHPAGRSGGSPQQIPLNHPPRSRDAVYISRQPQTTELTKVLQIKYPETFYETQFPPASPKFPDSRLQVFVHPYRSGSPCVYQAQQPGYMVTPPNVQYRSQFQFTSPPTQYVTGCRQSPIQSVQQFSISSSRILDQAPSARFVSEQSLSILPPSELPLTMEYLDRNIY